MIVVIIVNTLAKVVADVFSANGIKVYLFEDLRPTPELSFAVKHLDCRCWNCFNSFTQSTRIQWLQSILERWWTN